MNATATATVSSPESDAAQFICADKVELEKMIQNYSDAWTAAILAAPRGERVTIEVGDTDLMVTVVRGRVIDLAIGTSANVLFAHWYQGLRKRPGLADFIEEQLREAL